jgi:hypothetical protein
MQVAVPNTCPSPRSLLGGSQDVSSALVALGYRSQSSRSASKIRRLASSSWPTTHLA